MEETAKQYIQLCRQIQVNLRANEHKAEKGRRRTSSTISPIISPWLDIVNEVRKLASKGIDLLSLKLGMELDKHVSVASKLRANSRISSFRRSPQSGIEEEQLLLLISNTSSVILPNISDRWSWLLDPSG
ncbi:hypothetical protein Tco_0991396, partial [Tanacetum coccineum]